MKFFEKLNLKDTRKKELARYIFVITAVHIVGLLGVWVLTKKLTEGSTQVGYAKTLEWWMTFLAVLSAVTFLVGAWLLIVSAINEILLRETHEDAKRTIRAATHQFSEFEEHVIWIKSNLSPAQFSGRQVELYISVSTPVYGIAANDQSATVFLKYLEDWIEHFEKLRHNNPEKPLLEFAVWEGELNRKTFCNIPDSRILQKEILPLIGQFANLCRRIYALRNNQQINFKLLLTAASDTRVFMLRDRRSDEHAGLMVVFSPLIASSIQTRKWGLVGFSFQDVDGFRNLSVFNQKLQTRDYATVPPDETDKLFANPEKWLEDHYGLPPDSLKNLPSKTEASKAGATTGGKATS